MHMHHVRSALQTACGIAKTKLRANLVLGLREQTDNGH